MSDYKSPIAGLRIRLPDGVWARWFDQGKSTLLSHTEEGKHELYYTPSYKFVLFESRDGNVEQPTARDFCLLSRGYALQMMLWFPERLTAEGEEFLDMATRSEL